jgi:ankyrin repeat protein
LTPPVFHRDIKPQNLIGGKDGKVYLVDFGAVQNTYRSTFSYGSTVVGTFGYMAPEQFQGQALPATDLYGLGATLLFLLTHRSPADLPTDRLKISFRKRVHISEQFADWLEKMLEPDAEDRFVSAASALAALQRSKVVLSKSRQPIPRKPLIAIGLVAITLLISLKIFRYSVSNLIFPAILGVAPLNICNAVSEGDIDNMRGYLWLGGRISDLWNCGVNSERVANFLIAHTANINLIINKQGETPFHTILYYTRGYVNKKKIAELLIAKGADVNATDKHGNTVLHWAVVNNRYMSQQIDVQETRIIIDFLLSKDADVNAKDIGGNTPLHLTNSKEIAELLIANGADVNAKNNQGYYPLDMVINDWRKDFTEPNRHLDEMVELLILKGANVNTLYKEEYSGRGGDTPLHGTIKRGQNSLSELLVSRGANINAKNDMGVTPLDIASSSGNRAMSVLLRSRGAQDSGLCRGIQIFDRGSSSTEKYNIIDLKCGYSYNKIRVIVPK